jgi:hypothetical protein
VTGLTKRTLDPHLRSLLATGRPTKTLNTVQNVSCAQTLAANGTHLLVILSEKIFVRRYLSLGHDDTVPFYLETMSPSLYCCHRVCIA